MLKLRKVAVTGGLSCGKSSVCRFLKELGAYVVSADDIVHQLLSPKTLLGQKIIDLLGPDVLSNQEFDKAKIAKKVFRQPELLRSYEQLIHPAVREEIEKQYQKVKAEKSAQLFVAEIPLLFETGGNAFFDSIIVVSANQEHCKERFAKSKGYDPHEYERRSAMQLSIEEKKARADYVIENNGSLEELKQAVAKNYQQIIKSN